MRLLLALAVLAAAAAANHGDVIRTVLNSWDHTKPTVVLEHENTHSNRTKRSIPFSNSASYVPPSKACQTPGYTGEFCEFPICDQTNYQVPDTPVIGDTAWLDAAQLPNCSQSYVVLIDETVSNIRVSITSDKWVNPQVSLIGPSGSVVPFDDIWEQTPNNYELLFFNLDPGQYVAVPTSDVPDRCTLVVQAETNITVVGGFIQGDVYTAERNDYPTEFVYQGTPAVLAIHANRNRNPGKLSAVNFVAQQNVVYRPRMLSTRYGCGYEYYFESFTCSILGKHYLQVEGVTFKGFAFRRVLTFDCMPPLPVNTTVAPITTPTPEPRRCQNGGLMVKNLDGSQYCYCQGLWSGSDCSKILCLNGGSIRSDNTCQCDAAFNGRHCENVFCPDNSDMGFGADSPTLMLVVRGRTQMNYVIDQMVSAVNQYLAQIQTFDPSYLTTFVLVVFNNNKIILSERYIDFNDVVTDLQNAQKNFTADGQCSDSLFTAIESSLTLYPNLKSPMYVFTDATPNDASEAEYIIHQLSYWRVPINIIYTPTSPQCTLTPDDSTYVAMDDLAKKSMGATFYINKGSNVEPFFYQHMHSTIYRSQLMLSNDLASCATQNKYMAINVDIQVEQLAIIAVGKNLQLSLSPPDSPAQSLQPNYQDGENYIWLKPFAHVGIWMVSFNGSMPMGPCSFKVLQKTRHTQGQKNAQYDMFWAFGGGIDVDGPTAQPIYGYDLSMVVHLNEYPDFIPPQYVQAGLNIYASRGGVQTEVYASNGIWRDGCTYNFYFPPFQCRKPDETLYFNFYARDQLGMAIQRAGVMNCMHYAATPRPPTDCQNGGVLTPQNTTCYCPGGYTGNHCEKVNCYNGGTAMGSQCQCPVGWTGTFCTVPLCLQKNPVSPEAIRNYVEMIFAVELTNQGFAQLVYLNKFFAELLRDIQSQDPYWISTFVLVGYNSTWGGPIHASASWNPSGIIAALDSLAQTPPTDTGCVVQLYKALDRAITDRNTPFGSFIEIFQTSPADETESGGWGELYELTRQRYITTTGFLSWNARAQHGYFCNATYMNYQYLYDLTASNTGRVYTMQPANVQDAIKVIPLQYSSGIVYVQASADCSNNQMQLYFPVDAYTQTIQITTAGNNTAIQVYDSQGRRQDNSTFRLMHDGASFWDVWEIRKPCDANWTETGQYCTRFMTNKMTFDQAHNYCAGAGGFIVDDLNKDKHRFLGEGAGPLSFWIGLRNSNNTGYKWDRGNSPSVPLNQTDQFWVGGSGSPPAYNSQQECVFWDPNQKDGNTWTPDSCNTVRPFVCQKHRYDQNTTPTSLDSDILPAGKWYVNISSTTTNLAGGCFAEVRVQSKLQIYTGFQTSMTSDFPMIDPVNDSPNNMMITYIHSEDNEHRTPILTHALLYDAYNGTFYNAAQYSWKLGCTFPWMTQTFSCPNGANPNNEFTIAHVGEDEFGNMFQRLTFGHCSPKEITCGNGGYRSNGMCVCNEYWTGKYCTVPMCVNGGMLDSNNDLRCICPKGYGGPNCQYDECSRRIPYQFNTENRTLILLLEKTLQNKPAFTQLAYNYAAVVKNALNTDPTWFSNYVIITFNSTGIEYSHFKYTNPSNVQAAILAQSQSITDPGACTSNIYQALTFTLRQQDSIALPNSQILLVSASGAADYTNRFETIEQLSNSEASLHWLYMSDACGAQPSDPSVPHLTRLAYASNGNVAFMGGDSITQYLTPYLASRYHSQVLDNPTINNNLTCPNGSWLIQVDQNTTAIYISTTSDLGSVGVKDPNRETIDPVKLVSAGQTNLYKVLTDLPGLYTVTLVSDGSCYVSIYGVGGMGVYTHFAAPSKVDTDGSHTDGQYTVPYNNVPTIATFHLAGSPGHRGQLQYVEIVQPNEQATILRSELYPRTGCSWEYYSDPFTCTTDTVRLFIYGMDENNQQFRRQQLSFCINGTLPTNAPVTDGTTTPVTTLSTTTVTVPVPVTSTSTSVATTTTTPGAVITTTTTPVPTTTLPIVQMDVAFLIDVSAASKDNFDYMSNFITTLMSNYVVGMNGARIALIPVNGDGNLGTVPDTTFNTITSYDLLPQNLQQMKTNFNDFGTVGQWLGQALTVASDPNFLVFSNGWQADISNHLLIYVTSTTTFNDNPSTANILNNNIYGVITVATGNQIDLSVLQTLAGGSACSVSTNKASDLVSIAVPEVQALISKAIANGGQYCGNKVQ